MARLPAADRHRDRARERLRDLDPPRGPRRRRRSRPRGPASTSRCGSSPTATQRSVLRNYSLSGPPGAGYYRITVKREPHGTASGYLHTRLAVGDQLDIAAPRGTFILDRASAPVLLISAGIGATPVLAMLHALAHERSDREIWWLHGARSSREHAFAAEARELPRLAPERPQPRLLQPSRPDDRPGPRLRQRRPSHRVDARRARAAARRRGLPLRARRRSWRRSAPAWPRSASTPSRIHTEPFGPAPGLTPGIAAAPARPPHPPAGRARRRPDGRVRPQRPRRPVERRLRQPARARRGLRRPRPLVVPHRRLPQLRDDAHRRRASTTTPTRSNRPPTAARSSAALGRATTWSSTCEPFALEDRVDPRVAPLALEPQVLDEVGLLAHPEAPAERDRTRRCAHRARHITRCSPISANASAQDRAGGLGHEALAG